MMPALGRIVHLAAMDLAGAVRKAAAVVIGVEDDEFTVYRFPLPEHPPEFKRFKLADLGVLWWDPDDDESAPAPYQPRVGSTPEEQEAIGKLQAAGLVGAGGALVPDVVAK